MGGRVLAVLPDHPFPLDMGSRVRNLRILEALSREFELMVVTLVHDRRHLEDPGPAASLGRWIPLLAPHRRNRLEQVRRHLAARAAAAREGLLGETFFQSPPELSRRVEQAVREWKPDLVHSAYWYTLRHLAPFPRPPLWVVDTHDVQFERQARLFHRDSPREKARELAELRRYDRIVAITGRDRETLLRSLGPQAPPCEVISMGLDLETWRPGSVPPALPPAPRVAFYGNLATAANEEGAVHLCEQIAPGLQAGGSAPELLIIGANPGEAVRNAARACGARVTGFVEDVRPWLASASVLALTVRSGSGQRGRVVEALALGVPVVGYPEALEGLDLEEGEGIMSAGSAEEFRRRLQPLLEDPEAGRSLGEVGRKAVAARYGWEATYGRFPALYRELLAASRAEARG